MINIRDIVNENQNGTNNEPSIVRREPDKRGAFDRMDGIKFVAGYLETVVNKTDIANTGDDWHKAYVQLTKAFADCYRAESEIINK